MDLEGAPLVVLVTGVQEVLATAVARCCGAARIITTDSDPQRRLSTQKQAVTCFRLARRFGASAWI